ncbi:MAG: type II secretion system protein GspC [Gammaproteobacteria bacterium]|nr:type II secretion system protein GspC [Gammaproteobacteria bacterium]
MDIKSLPIPSVEQLQKWGPKLASVLLVIAISYTLTQLVWQLSGNTGIAMVPSPVPESQMGQSQHHAAEYADTITSYHLFGQSDVPTAGNDVISAPETKLNLDLLGILAIGEQSGLAIISGGGREEKVYKVGDQIPGNAILKAVYADRVLLESSGGLETLMMPTEGNLVNFVETGDIPAGKQSYDQDQNEYQDQFQNQAQDQLETQDPTSEISPQQLDEYRNTLSRNPAEIQKMANISQAMDGDKVLGYKLSPGPNSAMYRALGLQDGDIVTSVNGIDLTKPENSILALQKLRRAKQIDATILRDGQEMQISHSLNN